MWHTYILSLPVESHFIRFFFLQMCLDYVKWLSFGPSDVITVITL